MVIDPDPRTLPDTVSPEVIKPYTTRDNNHQVLGSYPKIIKEGNVRVINLLDHDSYLKLVSASPEKNLVVLDFYYNGHKNTSIEGEAAKMIQSQTEKMFAERSSNLTELKEVYDKNGEYGILNKRLNNLVLHSTDPAIILTIMEFNAEKKLNLAEIFKRFTGT